MPIKTAFIDKDSLRAIPLPTHGKSYTVIPHGHAVDETYKALLSAGFGLKQELYKTTQDGQVAQGVYHLDYSNDPDMGLMFAWSNSYDKSRRFKCAVGGHVFVCMNGILRGDISSFVRKHTGSALYEATQHINDQILKAKEHFDILVQDKEILKTISLTPKAKGTILGRLFAEDEILTLTQVGIVKREMDKPSHAYNCHPDSAWAMYNHITFALKESHPYTYLSDHERVHEFFMNEYGNSAPMPKKKPLVQIEMPFQEVVEEVLAPSNGVMFM